MIRNAMTALTALLLSACATMSPEQCMVADWYGLGEQDARAGRTADYLAERASACREAGYSADNEAWRAGFKRGLEAFCTLDNGFRFGVEGSRYQRSCPAEWEPEFSDGYQLGASIYALQQRVEQGDAELERVLDQIDKETDQGSPDSGKLADLRRQSERLQRQLRSDEVELATARGVALGRGFSLPY